MVVLKSIIQYVILFQNTQQNINEINLNFHLNDKYSYLSNNDKNACTCINMDFIVERLMISSEQLI